MLSLWKRNGYAYKLLRLFWIRKDITEQFTHSNGKQAYTEHLMKKQTSWGKWETNVI